MSDGNEKQEPARVRLEYAAAGTADRRRPGAAAEGGLGFMAYVVYLLATIGAWSAGVRGAFSTVALLGFGVLVVLAVYLHVKRGWRGFGAGLAIGVGLSCLLAGGGLWFLISTCKGV